MRDHDDRSPHAPAPEGRARACSTRCSPPACEIRCCDLLIDAAWRSRRWDRPGRPRSASRSRSQVDLDGVREQPRPPSRPWASTCFITPFFPARSNHRYDASTPTIVDPLLGDDDALAVPVEAAHYQHPQPSETYVGTSAGRCARVFRVAPTPAAPEREFYHLRHDGGYIVAGRAEPAEVRLEVTRAPPPGRGASLQAASALRNASSTVASTSRT